MGGGNKRLGQVRQLSSLGLGGTAAPFKRRAAELPRRQQDAVLSAHVLRMVDTTGRGMGGRGLCVGVLGWQKTGHGQARAA